MPQSQPTKAGPVIVIAAIALALLHHDFWWWNDATLVAGFLPIGLAYHALYSIAIGAFWWLAVTVAWPRDLEEWAREQDPLPRGEGGPPRH